MTNFVDVVRIAKVRSTRKAFIITSCWWTKEFAINSSQICLIIEDSSLSSLGTSNFDKKAIKTRVQNLIENYSIVSFWEPSRFSKTPKLIITMRTKKKLSRSSLKESWWYTSLVEELFVSRKTALIKLTIRLLAAKRNRKIVFCGSDTLSDCEREYSTRKWLHWAIIVVLNPATSRMSLIHRKPQTVLKKRWPLRWL